MDKRVKRLSNIDCLRILLGFFVIILHFNNPSDGGGLEYAKYISYNEKVLIVLEMLSICAVNVFMLISGYFLTVSHKRNYRKILELFIQCTIFMVIKYLILCIVAINEFNCGDFLLSFIPDNYFITLYSVVYLISVVFDYGLDQMNRKQLKVVLISGIALFSVIPTILSVVSELTGRYFSGLCTVSINGSQRGYTIVNFLLLYIIGACIRRLDIRLNISLALLGFSLTWFILVLWQLFYMKKFDELWGSIMVS